MKTKIIGFISLCLCLMACKSDLKLDSVPPKETNGYIMVVKFKQPEYKEHILVARPQKRDKYLTIMHDSRIGGFPNAFPIPKVVENIYGRVPYIELLNNYLLLDWKYFHVFATVILEEASIIINPWEEMEGMDDLRKTWPLENMYIKYPFEEIITIPIDNLNAYAGWSLKYPTAKTFNIIYKSNNDIYEYSEEQQNEIRQEAYIADCAYAEYKEVLNTMIASGERLADYKGDPVIYYWP